MASEIDELKELVRRNTAMAEDTNRMVHKIRRGALWGKFFQIVWWVAIVAVSAGAYYYYLQPYEQKVLDLYYQVQAGGQKAEDIQQQVQNYISQFLPHQATTTPTTTKSQ